MTFYTCLAQGQPARRPGQCQHPPWERRQARRRWSSRPGPSGTWAVGSPGAGGTDWDSPHTRGGEADVGERAAPGLGRGPLTSTQTWPPTLQAQPMQPSFPGVCSRARPAPPVSTRLRGALGAAVQPHAARRGCTCSAAAVSPHTLRVNRPEQRHASLRASWLFHK